MKRLVILLFILAAAVFPAVACDSAPTAPGTITDDLDRVVTIEQVPERIVSLSPGVTEILFALGLGDSVVGVTEYCDYPEEALSKPKVGGYFTTSLEAIVAQNPDVVFSDGHDPVCGQLDEMEMTMVVLQPKDIDGILRDIELAGEITARQAEAQDLVAGIEERIAAVTDKTALAERPTVFYVIDVTDPSKPWTAGAGSFVDALIELAGGDNIAAAVGEWAQFSLEVLISADPDIIIVDASHGEAYVPDFTTLAGWKEMSAVKNGAVHLVDGDLTSRPGPRIVEGLEIMADMIHPELFP